MKKIIKFKVAKFANDSLALHNAVFISPTVNLPANQQVYVKLTHPNQKQTITYPLYADPSIEADSLQMSMIVRGALNYAIGEVKTVELIHLEKKPLSVAKAINVELVKVHGRVANDIKMIEKELADEFLEHFRDYPLSQAQELIFTLAKSQSNLVVRITSVVGDPNEASTYQLSKETKLQFSMSPTFDKLTIVKPYIPTTLTLDFKAKGIGGHKNELERLVREAFYSRAMPIEFANAYGLKHTKGILLYGPPGTGKTLIAGEIGKLFTKDHVKIVNGPELKNKMVGQSEENLRTVFKEAYLDWEKFGENSPLHVIIFDEIDGLFVKRGMHSNSTGVDDGLVSQFLTILDGVESPKNILVIGTTNRKELIDVALLRPGRIGITMEIGLPNEADRLEILDIKTDSLKKNHLLDDDIDLTYFAKITKNFTGAEIENLMNVATSFALSNNFDLTDHAKALKLKEQITETDKLAKVSKAHFMAAFKQITPAFGVKKEEIHINTDRFVLYNEQIESAVFEYKKLIQSWKSGIVSNFNLLLTGPSGVGKTTLAKHLSEVADIEYIKVIAHDSFSGLTLPMQLQTLEDEFLTAKHSEHSLIILNDLEKILEADATDHGYNNQLRIKLHSLIKRTQESSSKCLVIATATSDTFLKEIGFQELFSERIKLASVSLDLQNTNALTILRNIARKINVTIIVDDKIIPQITPAPMTIRDIIYKIEKTVHQSSGKRQIYLHDLYTQFEPTVRLAPEHDKQHATTMSVSGFFKQH